MIRKNPASWGTEKSADALVGPPGPGPRAPGIMPASGGWSRTPGPQQWYGGGAHSGRRPKGPARPVTAHAKIVRGPATARPPRPPRGTPRRPSAAAQQTPNRGRAAARYYPLPPAPGRGGLWKWMWLLRGFLIKRPVYRTHTRHRPDRHRVRDNSPPYLTATPVPRTHPRHTRDTHEKEQRATTQSQTDRQQMLRRTT